MVAGSVVVYPDAPVVVHVAVCQRLEMCLRWAMTSLEVVGSGDAEAQRARKMLRRARIYIIIKHF
jgi:hypothetical protein